MVKFRGRFKGHGRFITVLAICDTVALLSLALEQECVHEVLGQDIRALSTGLCKISWAILLPSLCCSSGVVVLICLERFIAVWFPLKSKRFLSDRNISRALCAFLTPIVVIYAITPVLYAEIEDGTCVPNFPGTLNSTILHRLPNTTFYTASVGFILACFVLILSVFTPLIITELYKQRNLRRQLQTSGPNAQLIATEFKASVKLVAVVVSQLSLIGLPGIGYSLRISIDGNALEADTRSALALVFLLNHSINFILYDVFDAEFRGDILALLGFGKKDKSCGNINAAAKGMNAAAEGMNVAEKGMNVAAEGMNAAAEGMDVAEKGMNVAAEGMNAAAEGMYVAAEGMNAAAEGMDVAAEGIAKGMNVVAKGMNNAAEDINVAAEGMDVVAEGMNVTAEGMNVAADGMNVAAEGMSVAEEGMNVAAEDMNDGADGMNVAADGINAAAEGMNVASDGTNVAAEGIGMNVAAEDMNAAAECMSAAAECMNVAAEGMNVAAEGMNAAAAEGMNF